jgi:RecJ-like exonuclease
MRRGRNLLASALLAAAAACAPSISGINARPDKYYQHRVKLTGRIARMQALSGTTVFELQDARGARILVRAAAPVEVETGDWVRVEGILVPETRVDDTVLYDVVQAERLSRTHAPRLRNLM